MDLPKDELVLGIAQTAASREEGYQMVTQQVNNILRLLKEVHNIEYCSVFALLSYISISNKIRLSMWKEDGNQES